MEFGSEPAISPIAFSTLTLVILVAFPLGKFVYICPAEPLKLTSYITSDIYGRTSIRIHHCYLSRSSSFVMCWLSSFDYFFDITTKEKQFHDWRSFGSWKMLLPIFIDPNLSGQRALFRNFDLQYWKQWTRNESDGSSIVQMLRNKLFRLLNKY